MESKNKKGERADWEEKSERYFSRKTKSQEKMIDSEKIQFAKIKIIDTIRREQ
ncbi:hypothetical protein [Bacillus benzoevorans]|uniref:Uncharacterized protein n=1 Tax=Bacillus benzoevorans TaxID=1456 RepID=A0A7X0HRX3_9BACI|nr:hypothetical protein [Bacillus benzoevorans]MBB6445636.1 hypothetical protein [Bacillus benzoevorans]